jgi:hypothetical protein
VESRGYLGIDESNHGRFPEIFVAVYSEARSDIFRTEGLHRSRNGTLKVHEVLKGRPFKHILIPQEYKHILGENYTKKIKTIVLAEFISHFPNLGKVLVDGEISESIISNLEKILGNDMCNIMCEAHADSRYELVNKADIVAHLLHQHYNHKECPNYEKYVEHLLTPRIEHYLPLLDD